MFAVKLFLTYFLRFWLGPLTVSYHICQWNPLPQGIKVHFFMRRVHRGCVSRRSVSKGARAEGHYWWAGWCFFSPFSSVLQYSAEGFSFIFLWKGKAVLLGNDNTFYTWLFLPYQVNDFFMLLFILKCIEMKNLFCQKY